jgi:hypothetical protein
VVVATGGLQTDHKGCHKIAIGWTRKGASHCRRTGKGIVLLRANCQWDVPKSLLI